MKVEEAKAQVMKCGLLRQYTVGSFKYREPVAHVLLSSNPSSMGYMYHTVKMKPFPLSTIPAIEEIAEQTSKVVGIEGWNIGVDLRVYRDHNDGISWHSDDKQGESSIFTVILESPSTRPICIRKKCSKGVSRRDGDEYIELFGMAHDAYSMDGEFNSNIIEYLFIYSCFYITKLRLSHVIFYSRDIETSL